MKDLFHLFNSDMGIGEALLYSVLGMAIVFLMLAVLMLIIKIIGFVLKRKQGKAEPAQETAQITAKQPASASAPGGTGKLNIYDVPVQTAAIIMALIADSVGKPLNELRFISIREVK